MTRRRGNLVRLAVGAALCALLGTGARAEDEPSARALAADHQLFAQQILPLLKAKCWGCHGEGMELEGNLDLRTREALLQGGDTGAAAVPGKAAESLLYQSVLRSGERKMPPKESNRLTAAEIAALKTWIDRGAVWPAATTTNWSSSAGDTWAFQPVRPVLVPAVVGQRFDNPIDAFVAAKLAEQNLQPAPPAERVTLLRRATYDLTGLPPSPEEIDAFVNDDSPRAYETVVDRLLASPRYGEQWARHWLDVARYADTAGYANDFERPTAWRYRDYVVRSFNADKPYDRFVLEQIAGDELDGKPESLIATGFLRMGPWEHTGMSVAAVTRQLFLDDVTDSVGVTFLGLGLRCASCHDHKFDPIPTRDYYRLQAAFAPVKFEERPAPFLDVEFRRDHQAAEEARLRVEALQDKLKPIDDKQQRTIDALLKEKGVASVNELPENERPNKRDFGLTVEDMGLRKIYRKHLELRKLEVGRYQPTAFSVDNVGAGGKATVDDVFVLTGGALSSPGEKVTPGVLSAVSLVTTPERPSPQPTPGVPGEGAKTTHDLTVSPTGRRLALARWIADPQNPLTARVMVNRIWQHHFGRGLVETSNNFGKMGRRPSHPELLDWLAARFVADGWSVKTLDRLIVTSAAYRRGDAHPDAAKLATADPSNALLAYFPPRRLTAEELRDSLLAVGGELNLEMGGPPVRPEINQEAALQPRHIMGGMATPYEPSRSRAERNRRTLYTYQIRTLANPLLEVFNAPGMDKSCERRDATTVTPQVFALFNGQAAHDAALAMAQRVVASANDDAQRLGTAYRLAYGRRPSADEQAACLAHIARMTEHHDRTPPQVVEPPASIVRQMIEEFTGEPFTYVEVFDRRGYQPNLKPWDVSPATRAWAEVCLVLMNSNEFVYVY